MQKPSDRVIKAFDVTEEIEPIKGGEDRCWRAGELILKPCDGIVFWEWMAEYLPKVQTDLSLAKWMGLIRTLSYTAFCKVRIWKLFANGRRAPGKG